MGRWVRFVISLGVLAALAFPAQGAVAGASSDTGVKPEPLTVEETVELTVEDLQVYWKKAFPKTHSSS